MGLLRAVVFLSAAALVFCAPVDPEGCSSKDRDYCSVDHLCMYDYEMNTCGPLTCASYFQHNHCMADVNTVGPCDWNWKLNVCYPKDGVVPCHSYYVDCPEDRCTYDALHGYCAAKDQPLPCYLYYTVDTCPTDHCAFDTTNSLCLNKDVQKACSENYDSKTCAAATNGCQWIDKNNVCWPKGLDIPCGTYYDVSTCPTDRCAVYPVGSSESLCGAKDAPPPCEEYSDSQYCPNGRCAFNSGANRCYDPRIGLDCSEYLDNCPADKCRLISGQCRDIEQPIDCSAIYYGDASCNKDNTCRPDCKNKICAVCPLTGACDDTPCSNVGPDPGVVCPKYITEAECDPSICKWEANLEVCQDAATPVPCSDNLFEADCIKNAKCEWDIDECIECSSSGCGGVITTTRAPDTGLACSTYTEASCPYPRCAMHWTQGTEKELCEEARCSDFYDKTVCGNNKACSFNADIYTCYNTTEGLPCIYLGQQDLCTKYSNCEWNAAQYICSAKDTGAACNTYNQATCPSRCKFDYGANKCMDKSCRDFYTVEACVAPCTFNPATYMCYQDTGKACSAYTDYEDCPPNRCVFGEKADGSGDECRDQGCSDIYEEATCLQRSCKWLSDENICYTDDNQPCKAHTTYSTCPGNRCSWVTVGMSTDFTCADKVCYDYFVQAECVAAKCTWDSVQFSCYNDTRAACNTYLSYRDCPPNRCQFDYNVEKCRDKTCKDISDQSQCVKSPLGCEYNTQFMVCMNKGQPIPCSVYSYSTQCPTDRCVYASDVEICYEKGTNIPCESIYEQGPCDSRNTICTWDPITYRCVGKDVH